jgi:hypothetical protein
MPEETVKRRLQDAGDAALASDDGPIFSTVAKLVDALKRSIPEGTQNAELKNEALRLGRELLRGSKYEEGRWPNRGKWSAGRAAIAHAHDAQPRASHLRQPRAGFFRVQADRKGRRFPTGPLARVYELVALARRLLVALLRRLLVALLRRLLGTDFLREVKPRQTDGTPRADQSLY